MAEKFEDLIESSELNEEIRNSIVEAWESRLSEAREELTAELREEFAQRYEHDKGLIVEAVDGFIKERVEAELEEFLKFDFFPRVGGGIGMTRMIAALDKK